MVYKGALLKLSFIETFSSARYLTLYMSKNTKKWNFWACQHQLIRSNRERPSRTKIKMILEKKRQGKRMLRDLPVEMWKDRSKGNLLLRSPSEIGKLTSPAVSASSLTWSNFSSVMRIWNNFIELTQKIFFFSRSVKRGRTLLQGC